MTRSRLDIRRVRQNFSGHAQEYDRYALVQKRVAKNLLDLLLQEGEPAGAVLEVGTGTGMLASALLMRRPAAPLVVSDLAHGMTRVAAERLGVPALDADARALPVKGGAFSLVISSSVYQWVEDLPLAFGEAARVLSPGGRFAFALFAERTLWELREAHRAAAAEAGTVSHVQDFPEEERVRTALEGAGFASVRVVSGEETEYHRDVPALLRALKRIGAGNAAAERPARGGARRVMQRMMEIYEGEHRRAEGIPATYHVLYGRAEKGTI